MATEGGYLSTWVVLVCTLVLTMKGVVTGIHKESRYSNDVLVCFHGDDRELPDLGDHSHLYENIQLTRNKLPGKSCFTASRKVPARIKRSPGYTPSKIDDHEIQHAFGRHEGVAYVQQLVYHKRELRDIPNDSRWNDMWYLHGNTSPGMKVLDAWENPGSYSGQGLKIAVVDEGVELDHPDLEYNLNTTLGFDIYDNDTDPSPANYRDDHGTKVAGIIGAVRNNNRCISGIAFNCTLVPIRLLGQLYTTDLMEGDALMHQVDEIDIYSNSWGAPVFYGFAPVGPYAQDAIKKGIDQGRGGKGAIYVFAAGNSKILDNCNADGYANSIYTIAISSLASNGEPAGYAEICPTTFAVAYGGDDLTSRYVVSTNTLGRCSSELQGTSFAAPQASAVIALALEANPNLTWRDVQHLLVLTSKSEGITERLYGWHKNGQGKNVSQLMGFGLLDAEAMVREAVSWVSVPNIVTTNATSTASNQSVGATKPNATLTIDVASAGTRYLEHVQVPVVAKCTQRSQFSLTLTSPMGTISYLMTTRQYDTSTEEVDFTFSSVQFWGERPEGQWSLTFGCEGSDGYLSSWSLHLRVILDTPDYHKGKNYCSTCNASSTYSCTELWYGPKCVCEAGFDGELCDNNIDECALYMPCQHGGTCIDGINYYNCTCGNTGYEGKNCTIDIDECTLYEPCMHNTSCTDMVNDWSCNCTGSGYTDLNCSTIIDDCRNGSYVYNETCIHNGNKNFTCNGETPPCCANSCELGTWLGAVVILVVLIVLAVISFKKIHGVREVRPKNTDVQKEVTSVPGQKKRDKCTWTREESYNTVCGWVVCMCLCLCGGVVGVVLLIVVVRPRFCCWCYTYVKDC